MRKVHVIMFACQIAINIIFSILLFCGLLRENVVFAFIYPISVFVYLVADMFVTTFTTDLIVKCTKEGKARIISIAVRDLLIISVWFCFLLSIGLELLILWGTLIWGALSYALPKVVKIIICDIINQQKYLDKYIEI